MKLMYSLLVKERIYYRQDAKKAVKPFLPFEANQIPIRRTKIMTFFKGL